MYNDKTVYWYVMTPGYDNGTEMKQPILTFTAILLFTLLAAACQPKTSSAPASSPEEVHTGPHPGDDGNDIGTTVTFHPDGTVVKSTHYEKEDHPSMTESGQWKMNDRGRITAVFPSGKLRFQSGSKGMEIPDIHGHSYHKEHEKYILRKSSAKDSTYFTGNWALEGYNGKGYRQIMKIHGETANDIMVSISFSGARKGCQFSGKGVLSDGQITIPLKNTAPDMKGTIIIRPADENETLSLSTLNPEDRNELMYFCGGGASLAGDYKKLP